MESNSESPYWAEQIKYLENKNKEQEQTPIRDAMVGKTYEKDTQWQRVVENLNKEKEWKKPEIVNANANISHPSHYIDGREFEPKDVIRDWDLNFNLGSAVKYISRAGRKGDAIEDLQKAQQFIQFEIDALEKERSSKSN